MGRIFQDRERRNMGGGVYAPSRSERERWDELVESESERYHAEAVSGDHDVLHDLYLATICGDTKTAHDFEAKIAEYARESAYRALGFWLPDFENT